MPESFFDELKRYVRFGAEEEAALSGFAAAATPHFARIAEQFYARVVEFPDAHRVFDGPAQVDRLKLTLCDWMALLFAGPWDVAYYERRARIGRVHVAIGLPQRFMFGAMDLIRVELLEVAHDTPMEPEARRRVVRALHKILDIELAIMLETYGEAFVEKVQYLERLEKASLERQLALSEARYEEIVEKGEALVLTCEPSGHVLLFNRRCEDLTGIERRTAASRSWFELFCAGEDRPAMEARFEQIRGGERVPPYEGPVFTPAGRGRRVRWHFTTLPGAGYPILCAIGVDVTEEYELGVRTRRAERLAALGTMAAGLAHEIRNPLNAAHIQLTVAQRRLARAPSPENEGARDALELVSSEMKRLAGLVEDFLQFARPHPLRLAFNDLRATADATLSLVAPEASAAGVELSLLAGEPVRLEFDHEKIKQVLLNLVRNAVEAASPRGSVRVSVGEHNGAARLAVEDDGHGFPSGAPVFEPFFTTKESGTGLGLAIVHRIISDHGGTIDVESRPGHTVFTVSLPIATESADGQRLA